MTDDNTSPLSLRVRGWWETGWAIIGAAQSVDLPFLAAAVAFYALASIVPLVTLALAIATTIDAPGVGRVIDVALATVPAIDGEKTVADAVVAPAGRAQATVLGMAVLLWTGSRVFRGIDVAFGLIYGSATDSWLQRVGEAALLLVTVIGSLLVLTLAVTISAQFAQPPMRRVGVVLLPVVITIAVLPAYRILPDTRVRLTEALPGATVTALAWTGVSAGFGAYTALAGNYAAYGALGVFLLFIVWLYLLALCFLLGAVINAVLATEFVGVEHSVTDTDRPVDQRPR